MSNLTTLNTWNDVEKYLDNGFLRIKPTYLERVAQGNYPRDAFSKGQLASKSWLLKELYSIVPLQPNATVAILGCWIGSIVEPLHDALIIKRIYGIDIDPAAIELAEKFNQKFVQDEWKFKGVVADTTQILSNNMEFQTSGELIQVKPDWIINTSCEHMDLRWFETADSDQLIIMQTNDSEGFEGHINTCKTIEDMFYKYPMQKRMYAGALKTPAYTRFMQIGYR